MTIIPAIVFIIAVALALAFELFYAFLYNKFCIYLEKDLWTLFYWIAVVMLGMTCGLILLRPLFTSKSIPLFFVASIHIWMNLLDNTPMTFQRPFMSSYKSKHGGRKHHCDHKHITSGKPDNEDNNQRVDSNG